MMQQAQRKVIKPENDTLAYLSPRIESDDDSLFNVGQSLAFKLQRTLNLENLLSTFCEECVNIVPCASVAFRNDEQSLFVYHGEKHVHLCQYTLELEGSTLGFIECSSPKPFTEKELKRLEYLLSLLVFPLRNALMYQTAIQMAHKDPLTQLANRGAFDHALETEVSRAHRHGVDLTMLVIDIDFFKKINDTYGHLAGDQVLKEVANKITGALRKEDQVFRFGGEEFVVLLSATAAENATMVAERIRKQIEQEAIRAIEVGINITVSIGLSSFLKGENGNTLFHRADQALYAAKSNGRNQVKVA